MPIGLLQRCQPDCLKEFRGAAFQRYQDGLTLFKKERRTGAIYLWGYAAEMLLKAAYFQAIGYLPGQPIGLIDLKGAVTAAKGLGVKWPGNLHYLLGWSELILKTRASIPGLGYPSPAFAIELESQVKRIQHLWSEVLRYHKNIAYRFEVAQTRGATEWLLVNASRL